MVDNDTVPPCDDSLNTSCVWDNHTYEDYGGNGNYHSITEFQYYAWGVVGNSIAAFGILGNILSIAVLINRRMLSSTSYYLLALAVFDTIVLLSLVLFLALPTIHSHTGNLRDYYYFFPYMQPYAYPIALTAQTCSIYTTVAFTIERFIAVCFPLRAAEMCTLSRARKAIILIVLCSLVYNIPRMVEYRVREFVNPYTNETVARYEHTAFGANITYRHVYHIYMNIVFMLLIPTATLTILNIQLIRAVRRSQKTQRKMNSRVNKENNLTVMLISVVGAFIVCQVPSIADNIFGATYSQQELSTPPFVRLTTISNLMVITNSAINFYLYCVFGERFRRVFCSIFCSWYVKRIKRFSSETDTMIMSLKHRGMRDSVRGGCYKPCQSGQASATVVALDRNDHTAGRMTNVVVSSKPIGGMWANGNCRDTVDKSRCCEHGVRYSNGVEHL